MIGREGRSGRSRPAAGLIFWPPFFFYEQIPDDANRFVGQTCSQWTLDQKCPYKERPGHIHGSRKTTDVVRSVCEDPERMEQAMKEARDIVEDALNQSAKARQAKREYAQGIVRREEEAWGRKSSGSKSDESAVSVDADMSMIVVPALRKRYLAAREDIANDSQAYNFRFSSLFRSARSAVESHIAGTSLLDSMVDAVLPAPTRSAEVTERIASLRRTVVDEAHAREQAMGLFAALHAERVAARKSGFAAREGPFL